MARRAHAAGFRDCSRIPRLKRRRIWGKRSPIAEDELGSHAPSGPPPPFTLEQQAALDWYLARPTRDLQRACWVPAWMHASSRAFPASLSRAEIYKRGRERYKSLDDQQKLDVFQEALRKGYLPRTKAGAPQGNRSAAKEPVCATTLLSSGFLLTWNQPVPENRALRMLLQQVRSAEPSSPKYDKLMQGVRDHPIMQREWASFEQFLLDKVPLAGNITELSACLELSLKGVDLRWHLHAMVSNKHPDVGLQSTTVTLHMHRLNYKGFRPHGSCARGRGKQASVSVDRMHAYCQWPKVGSVQQRSNFRRGIDFSCKASWVLEAWQQRKLSAETARSEIIHNRDRVEPALRQLDTYEEMVQAELMLDRHTKGVAAVAAQLLPFKSDHSASSTHSGFTLSITTHSVSNSEM